MLTKQYNYSIIKYNYINKNYKLSNYEIYDKMCKENKDVSWAYNVYFIEKYWEDK
tara:strand:- start:378 stop:542 length:165 start_codon:yes stop_codon:yes gene_type:complete